MKMLIVDDELIIRQWFVMTIEKLGGGFTVAGEAGNGAEALEFCKNHPVDLVITDIKMPVMDGIELMKVLKAGFPQVKTLVLSSYSDFAFAKEAIRLGASDYILKAEVTVEQLREVLEKIGKEIEIEKRHSSEESRLRTIFNDNLYGLRVIYFKELLTGSLGAANEFESKMEFFKVRLERKNLIIAAFSIDHYKNVDSISKISDKKLMEFSIVNITDEILNNELGSGCCIRYEDNLYLAFFNLSFSSVKSFRENMQLTFGKIADIIKKFTAVDVSVGIGMTCSDLALLGTQLGEAVQALNQKNFYGGRSLVFFQEIQSQDFKTVPLDMNSLFKEVAASLETGDTANALLRIRESLGEMKNRRQLLATQVRKFCLELIYLFVTRLRQLDADEGEISDILGEPHLEIQSMGTYTETGEWVESKLQRLCQRLHTLGRKYSEPVQNAYEYMVKNYSSELSLNQMADRVHLNRSYFCELFKKETGKSFNDFLTEVRMNKARELLAQTDTKIGEVAELTGYPNVSYFSKIFKKQTGLTPFEYRDRGEKRSKKADEFTNGQ